MRVLVLKEKHGEDYFAVPADKEGVVMLHVIQRRFEQGWYGVTYDAVEGRERELLHRCIEENDFTAAIEFFKLRQNAEYEGWELVNAHILPGAQYAYSPLPIGCRERYDELGRRASKLMMTFINDNRKDTLEALEKMDTKAALAVLSEMMIHGPELRGDLNRWLKEVA